MGHKHWAAVLIGLLCLAVTVTGQYYGSSYVDATQPATTAAAPATDAPDKGGDEESPSTDATTDKTSSPGTPIIILVPVTTPVIINIPVTNPGSSNTVCGLQGAGNNADFFQNAKLGAFVAHNESSDALQHDKVQGLHSGRGHVRGGHAVPTIINGIDTKENQICWGVRILAEVPDGPLTNNPQIFSISTCGGSIIGSRTILTAAHCLFNTDDLSLYSARFFTVRIGARNDAVSAKPQGCEKDFKVTRAFPHPGYRPTMTGQSLKQTNNDIALLTLAEDIDFANSPCACPLCLEDKVPEVGAQCIANGVGVQNNNNDVKAMQYAQLDVKDALSGECLSAANKEEDNSLFVCAGGETRGTSTCQGDSGGPLACLDANGKFYSAGVSSYAVTNCPSTRPAHFSKTQRYLDWIRTNAEQSQLSFV